MLEVIKYITDDEKKITFRCPKCQNLFHDWRSRSDPKDSTYGIMRCDDCCGRADLIFYDKNDFVIEALDGDEDYDDEDSVTALIDDDDE